MALYTGQHGILFHEKSPDGKGNSLQQAANVRSWQVNMTQQMLPVTRLGDTWEDRLGGLKSITGTAEIYYYRNSNGSDSTVSELFDRFLQQDTQARNYSMMFRLRQDGTNSDLKFWGLISNFTMTCSVGEVVTAQITFESDRAPRKENF